MSSWHCHIPWAYLQKHQKDGCCTDADALLLMVLADVFQSLLGCPLQHEAVWIGENPNKTNYVWVVQWAQLVQFISHIAVVFGELGGTVAGCVIITIEDLHSYLCFSSVSLLGTMTDNKMCSYTSLLTRNINNRTRNHKRHLKGGIYNTFFSSPSLPHGKTSWLPCQRTLQHLALRSCQWEHWGTFCPASHLQGQQTPG